MERDEELERRKAELIAGMAKVIDAAIEPMERVARRWAEIAEASVPGVVRFLASFRRFEEWLDVAPQQLQCALAGSGHAPAPDLSIADLRATTETFGTAGPDAAVEYYDTVTRELTQDPAWQLEARARLLGYSKRPERAPILVEAFDAYVAGMYAVAVPTLVAQFEGVLVDVTGFTGRSHKKSLTPYLDSFTEFDSFFGPHVRHFFGSTWFSKFDHGDELEHGLSRHSIMHGGNVTYANERTARQALLWVDYLIQVATMREAEEAR
jgi:hypothetical protein